MKNPLAAAALAFAFVGAEQLHLMQSPKHKPDGEPTEQHTRERASRMRDSSIIWTSTRTV